MVFITNLFDHDGLINTPLELEEWDIRVLPLTEQQQSSTSNSDLVLHVYSDKVIVHISNHTSDPFLKQAYVTSKFHCTIETALLAIDKICNTFTATDETPLHGQCDHKLLLALETHRELRALLEYVLSAIHLDIQHLKFENYKFSTGTAQAVSVALSDWIFN